MKFIVYQCIDDPDYFLVTDDEREYKVPERLGPSKGKLRRIGRFEEMGKDRLAFDETLANSSIDKQGFYLFEATSFAPVPETPEMPG